MITTIFQILLMIVVVTATASTMTTEVFWPVAAISILWTFWRGVPD